MPLLGLIGMTLLRLGVLILVMGLLSAALKRIVPEAVENKHSGAYHRYTIGRTAPKPAEKHFVPVQA